MSKLIGTGNDQVPTNGMLGGMAFQSPEDVQVDKVQENRFDVVTQTDIGTLPNQIPLVQMLGTNAFTNIDYQQGNFTAIAAGDTTVGTFTADTNSGTYVKIGKCVFMTIRWQNAKLTGATGVLRIINLPFPMYRITGYSSYLEGLQLAWNKTVNGNDSLVFRSAEPDNAVDYVNFRPSWTGNWDVYASANSTIWQRIGGSSTNNVYGEIHLIGYTQFQT